MNIFKLTVLCAALVLSSVADAKGGSSSGGGGHASSGGGRSSGGMSSGRSPSYSSTSRANSAPSVAPTNRPNSAPSIAPNSPNAPRPNSAPVITPNAPRPATPTPRTTSTTTTTTSSSYSRNVNYGGGMAYGGMGMGYGYSNGILTGLLIGSMLHPHNTVVYAGGGSYNNNALLYPDGRVVNQQGYQVGTYQNGQFTNVQNGAMVAQNAPADAYTSSQPQQVVIVKQGPTTGEIVMGVLVGIASVVLIVLILL